MRTTPLHRRRQRSFAKQIRDIRVNFPFPLLRWNGPPPEAIILCIWDNKPPHYNSPPYCREFRFAIELMLNLRCKQILPIEEHYGRSLPLLLRNIIYSKCAGYKIYLWLEILRISMAYSKNNYNPSPSQNRIGFTNKIQLKFEVIKQQSDQELNKPIQRVIQQLPGSEESIAHRYDI